MRRVRYHKAYTNLTVKRCPACWKGGAHDDADYRKNCIFSVCHGATHSAFCAKCHKHSSVAKNEKRKKMLKSKKEMWADLQHQLRFED